MSYSVSQQNGKDVYNLKRFIVDEVADMGKLPTSCAPGSTAFVVATSQTFMLNNKRQWIGIIGNCSGGHTSGT